LAGALITARRAADLLGRAIVISPDGCVQIRPIWRLFGRRTRPLMHEGSALGPSACAIEHGDAADYAMTIAV